MEWRQQSSVSCADAFTEARRWIEEVTGKLFGSSDFRASLENGVLLCDLINQLKPGIIKKVNRLSTPIAGLDNVSLFLKACGKLGLNVSQLFHPGDLQDLSTRATLRQDESKRRLKNVLITIYWLGRKAQLDAFYKGPQLNFKAFEGLLGLALSKVLDEGTNVCVKDGWYPEREACVLSRPSSRMENSVDLRTTHPNSEGCGSDAEAEQDFKMDATQPTAQHPQGKAGPEDDGRDLNGPLARLCRFHIRPGGAFQVNPGWIWSKSLSDIPLVCPARKPPGGTAADEGGLDAGTAGEWEGEDGQRRLTTARDTEAQWQDDLTKWKNRRRSTKSDLRTRSQDREHVIKQMINGASTGSEQKLRRDQQSPWRGDPAPRRSSSSPPSKSLSLDLQRPARAPLARSFATEELFSPSAPLKPKHSAKTSGSAGQTMPACDGSTVGEETRTSCMASGAAGAAPPSADVVTRLTPKAENELVTQISTLVTTLKPTETTKSTSVNHLSVSVSSVKTRPGGAALKCQTSCPEPLCRPDGGAVLDHGTPEEAAVEPDGRQQAAGVYRFLSQGGSWSRSASLPRGFRRSEGSSRLSSAITARPFGAMQPRVSSLPKLCNVDDKQGLLPKSEKEESLFPLFKSSLRRQTATAQLMGPVQVPADDAGRVKQNAAEQLDEVRGGAFPSRANGYGGRPHAHAQPTPPPDSQDERIRSPHVPPELGLDGPKVDHSDMRVSLALKPNSRPDFGFQTRWDSTGLRVAFIQPGSPAELCRLRADDEIVAVNGLPVAHMSCSQWTEKMTSSLQTGSVTMDIRRYGSKDWSSSSSSSSSSEGGLHSLPGQSRMTLNLTSASPVLISCRPDGAVGRASGSDGQTDHVTEGRGVHEETAGNHSTAKGRASAGFSSWVYLCGGSESAISDLQVPSLSSSSPSWSWDREEDRRRQEKWQEEQERLLQRDQERLEAEWRRAQRDATGELRQEAEGPGAFLRHNTLEMINGVESHVDDQLDANGSTRTGGPSIPDAVGLRAAGRKSLPSRAADREASEEPWADGCGGLSQLSPAHRSKSMSTPLLAVAHKQIKGGSPPPLSATARPRASSQPPAKPATTVIGPGVVEDEDEQEKKKRKGHPVSKVEMDRQKILEEMKKRTQLLTDNSWIRQRSSSSSIAHKEPICLGFALKRFESLDDLDSLRQPSPSSCAAFAYPRPHSAAAGYCAPSRNSSSRYSSGAILPRRPATADCSHHGSVWAAANTSDNLRLESRSASETESRTVSPAISGLRAVVASP
ncbi:uncharacterized protein LOC142884622 isoform X6 [Nelusetta ayraudi]|uniref:uncharacterized protein LOC142884622 isoform X6 n=1 Tax=Nelusetta ayraudi TaxID=303726 RepID=UPI003F6F0BE3